MKPVFLFIFLFVIAADMQAQEKVWKRRVSRMVDIRDKEHTDKSRHSTLSAALLKAVKTQKIKAYTAYDNNFTTVMTPEEFAIHCEQIDTTYVRDPATDSDVMKVVNKTVIPDSIYAYRIFEDWVFDPASAKLTIQARYVAPLENVYSDEGYFRGRRPLFWIGYHDFSSAMEVTDILLVQLFYRYLWQSYFDIGTNSVDDYFNSKTGLWMGNAISVIDMQDSKDTARHFLRDENNDTLLSEFILTAAKNGVLPAWAGYDPLLSPQLSGSEISDLVTGKVDTEVIYEWVTGIDQNFRPGPREFDYNAVHKYFLLQHWSFNSITGITEIDLKTVGLIRDIYGDDGTYRGYTNMFWIRYADIIPILNKVAQYHPNNTFAMRLWNSFFLSDKKPELQK